MANKYKFGDIFNEQSFKKGFQSLENQLKDLDKMIKNLGKGAGIKEVNKAFNQLKKTEQETAKIQSKRLQLSKLEQQRAKALNKENQKRYNQMKRVNDALNEEKVFEKELQRLKAQRIRQEQRLKAQRELGIKQTKSWSQSVKSFISQLKGLIVGVYMFQRLKAATDKYVEAATNQAIVEQKLETILKQRTGATEQQVRSVIRLTQAEQKRGILGDEIQIAGAQQIATFVTTTKNVKTLIPAINNLVAQQKGFNATQQDAVNVANALGKVFTGQIGALTRYGITIDENSKKILNLGTEEEKAAELAKVITNNVGEMNAELANTDIGKLQQMNNVLGDIEEKIGRQVLPLMVEWKQLQLDILNGIQNLSKGYNVLAFDQAKANVEQFADAIRYSDELTKQNAIKSRFLEIEAEIIEIQKFFIANRDRMADLDDEEIKKYRERADILQNEKKLLIELGKTGFFSGQFKQQVDELTTSQENYNKTLKKTTEETKRLADEIQRIIQLQGETLRDPAIAGSIDRPPEEGGLVRSTLELIERGLRSEEEGPEAQSFIERIFNKIFGTGEDGDKRKELIKQAATQLFETIKTTVDTALERIDQLIDRQQDAIDNTTELLENEKNRLTELQAAGAAFDTKEQQRLEKQLAADKVAKQKLIDEEKRFREKQKRLAIIEAGINVASNVIKALGQPPIPGTNWIAAALAAALGFAQISTIKAAKFAKGTNYLQLNGNPDGTDTIPIWADKGERIVPRKDNAKIPRTFPNSLLPAAVSYYIDSKAAEGNDTGILSAIEKNTRKDGRIYRDGKLYQVNGNNMTITYG
jgi:hypothetical protein